MTPLNQGQARSVKIVDPQNENRDAKFDPLHQAIVVQNIDHYEIHDGCSFERHIDSANLPVASINIAFKTKAGNKLAHMLFGFSSSDEILFEILEGVTWTQGSGEVLEISNHYRPTSPESELILEDKNQALFTASNQIMKNVTGISGDSSLEARFENQFTYNAGLGISVQAESRSAAHEWVLKPDETYLVRMTQTDDNCKMSLDLHWYEHTNE